MKRGHSDAGHAERRGFSLVEVTLAVVVLTVGLLALASTAGGIARMIGRGGGIGRSAIIAAGRLDLLRATRCRSLVGGSAVEGPYSESWTVVYGGADTTLAHVELTLTYRRGGGMSSDAYATAVRCAY
jgi:prepilin-type N-terminal cleavage/methylation domain-containing protein